MYNISINKVVKCKSYFVELWRIYNRYIIYIYVKIIIIIYIYICKNNIKIIIYYVNII